MAVSADPREREARARDNHALFRELDERLRRSNDGFAFAVSRRDWVCECANHDCVERIEMSAEEYEGLRLDAARFLVFPGDEHCWPDAEHLTKESDRYWIVEKIGPAAERAKRYDSRSSLGPLWIRT